MKLNNKLCLFFCILFVVSIALHLWRQKHVFEQDDEIEYWRAMFHEAKNRYDSIALTYDSVRLEIIRADSLYQEKISINKNVYEKVIDNYRVLSVDGHIDELTKYLSEKDSL